MVWVPQDGQNVRFYSKLQPDLVLAGDPALEFLYVHQMANGDAPDTTVFQLSVKDGPDYPFQVYMRNLTDAMDQKLSWTAGPNGRLLTLNPYYQDSGDADYFSYDTLDPDPWIAINNYTHDLVVDVYGSESYEGARIDGYAWNGGDNQWWRVVPA